MTVACGQEKMSSGSIQPSPGVSTLNHNTLQLAGRQWWPVTAHLLLAPSSTPPFYSRASKTLSLLPHPTYGQLPFSPFLLYPEL